MKCVRQGVPLARAVILGLGLIAVASQNAVAQQQRWVVDRKGSLAWWQVNPHMDHLWATSCPEEPSWRPGEGRSAGWVIDRTFSPAKHGSAAVSDTSIIPLYPRRKVRFVCTEALDGRVLVADTNAWKGIRGQITVRADAMITGEKYRDEYARGAVLETRKYPEVKFTIDSIVRITERRDTIRGTAVGMLTLRGVAKPITAGVRAWPDTANDGMRVLAKMNIPAQDLWPEYGISKFALGLGIGAGIWKEVWMGVDLLMRPDTGTQPSGGGGEQ
jgi:polyisoprenoid-binding protein YceI